MPVQTVQEVIELLHCGCCVGSGINVWVAKCHQYTIAHLAAAS